MTRSKTLFSMINQALYGDGSVTPRVVLKWCEDEDLSCYYSAMNQLHTKAVAENHKNTIAFSWFDNHMHLYESARWCQTMEPKPIRPPKARMLQSSVAKDPVAFDGEYARIRPGM